MGNKTKFILVLIAIIFVIGAATYFVQFYNQDTVLVGKTYFVLPHGYTQGTTNEFGNINITNGVNTLFISEFSDEDLNKHMMDYVYYKKNNNFSTTIDNFTIDNVNISKVVTSENNKTIVHYWFVKNGTTYDISSWDSNNQMDSTVIDLINSMKYSK